MPGNEIFVQRFELVKKNFQDSGIKVTEGNCLREDNKCVSATKEERAKDFIDLWKDKSIDLILPPWGGESLIDILELIDFEELRNSPTWVQGYSDISTLLFPITICSGIATAHGTNFLDSINGQDFLTSESRSYLSVKKSQKFIQTSSNKWQKEFVNFATKLDAQFNLTEPTKWKVLNDNCTEIKGRIIGGCIDTIKNLIGTPYGDIPKFSNNYCPEGIVLYLENCELLPTDLYRALWNMKYSGWFDNINGVIFGRSNGPEDRRFSYLDCLNDFLSDFKFPIIYDADIGHRPPQMTIINGSLANIKVENGTGTLEQSFD